MSKVNLPSWRESARPIIAKVLEANADKTLRERRQALKDAYPWGPRKYHPYKIWCDEINVQLKKRRFGKKNNQAPKEQLNLF